MCSGPALTNLFRMNPPFANGAQSRSSFNAQANGHEHVEADQVTIKQGSAQSVDAREVVAKQSGIQTVHAEQVEIRMGGAGQVTASSFRLEQGGVGLAHAETAELENARAALLVTRHADVQQSRVLLLVAGQVSGEVQTLLDSRLAVLAGAAFGFVLGLFMLMAGRRRA